jgi:deoxyribose-phosphate aldolase
MERRLEFHELKEGEEYAFPSGLLCLSITPREGARYDFTSTGFSKSGTTIEDLEVPYSSPVIVPLVSYAEYPMKVKATRGSIIITFLTGN